jgi:nitronate monooxygenase
MNFAALGSAERKAWKDIWSAGQSVSGIHSVEPVAALVARLAGEYSAVLAHLELVTPNLAP